MKGPIAFQSVGVSGFGSGFGCSTTAFVFWCDFPKVKDFSTFTPRHSPFSVTVFVITIKSTYKCRMERSRFGCKSDNNRTNAVHRHILRKEWFGHDCALHFAYAVVVFVVSCFLLRP